MISKNYSDFLKEIIDDSMKTACEHSDKKVTDFFTSYNISYDEAYAYFLKHYGNDYIKDGFVYCRKNEKYEMNILFGLDSGNGNICKEIEDDSNFLPGFMIPIIALPSGDFVCMDKNDGRIYFWFHDTAMDNLLFVEKSFEKFILHFEKSEEESSVKPVSFSIDSDMDNLLKKTAEKYKMGK
jgi:hypothetical protein